MSRPRKQESDLRQYQVNIRLKEKEKKYAKSQAEMAGLSVANWLRIAAFSKKALQVKVTPLHREYYRQLVGIASNINQSTRKINSGEYPKIYQELLDLKKLLLGINELLHR